MIRMSHRETYYSCTRTHVYYVSCSLLLPVYFRMQLIARVLVISRVLVTLFVCRHAVTSAMRLLLDR